MGTVVLSGALTDPIARAVALERDNHALRKKLDALESKGAKRAVDDGVIGARERSDRECVIEKLRGENEFLRTKMRAENEDAYVTRLAERRTELARRAQELRDDLAWRTDAAPRSSAPPKPLARFTVKGITIDLSILVLLLGALASFAVGFSMGAFTSFARRH